MWLIFHTTKHLVKKSDMTIKTSIYFFYHDIKETQKINKWGQSSCYLHFKMYCTLKPNA